jgi:transposase
MEGYEKEGKNIVHLDESGFEKETLRDDGYAKIGTRCVDVFDWQAKGRTNVIGAIFGGILLGIGLFEFNINADVFHGWVVQCLLPALPSNSVVVMDNASFHKRQDIQEAITQAGHILEYLPPYSPDLNPIEKNGRKLKLSVGKKDVLSMNFSSSAFDNHFIVR